jgi:phage shock protein C
MICPNCQKDIAGGSKFCYSCGAKQPEAAAANTAPPYAYPGRKRLVRSTNDRKLAGVCAGIADYFDLDVTIVRVLWVLAVLFAGTGVLAYGVLWVAVPEGITGMTTQSATPAS